MDQSFSFYIESVTSNLAMLVGSNEMKQAKNKIKNYINISNIVTKDEGATDEELKLKRFLRMVKESNSGYDYIFVGTESGEFVMVPDGELGSNYDPRKRGWYQQGIGSSQ